MPETLAERIQAILGEVETLVDRNAELEAIAFGRELGLRSAYARLEQVERELAERDGMLRIAAEEEADHDS